MCDGIPVFSNNKKALHGTGTSSHSTAADKLGIKEDHYLKSEYHWWDKEFKPDHYDSVGVNILKENGVDIEKATEVARNYIKKNFHTQAQLVAWLKKTPSEWGRLMVTEHKALAKKVNPKLVLYQDKVAKFKKENIEKYNPYQTIKLPTLAALKEKIPAQVGAQVWAQVWAQVGAQVGDQVGGSSVGSSVGDILLGY